MGKVKDAWSRSKTQGGIVSNEMEASYRDLFTIFHDIAVPDMYQAIEKVMQRINTYEYEYENDEAEAHKLYCKVSDLDPCRENRKKMDLVESYKLKVNIDRAIGWLVKKLIASNLATI